MTKRKIVMIPKDKELNVLAGTYEQNRITLDIFYANGFETRAGGKLADYALTDAETYSYNEDGKNELTYWSETKVAGALTPEQFHRKYGAIIGVVGKAKTEKKVVKPEITLASATKFAIVDETKPDLMQCHKEEKVTPKSAYHMVPILDKDGLLDCYHLIRTIEAHNNKPMDSAKQHALKKIAFGGHRGHKDEIIDISEAIGTLTKYKEWLERNNGK